MILGLSKLIAKPGIRSDKLEKQIAGVPLACESQPEWVSELQAQREGTNGD